MKRRILGIQFVMTAVGLGTGACVEASGGSQPPDAVDTNQSPLHSVVLPLPGQSCAQNAYARVPELLLSEITGYGNWCGSDVSGRDVLGNGDTGPISCWDDACRVHDYAFGRWQDGNISCHSVVTEQNMASVMSVPDGAGGFIEERTREDTQCTLAADDSLCQSWAACNDQVDLANATWKAVGNGKNKFKRICNPHPPGGQPANPGPREATRCDWLNTWTCEDLFPCPLPPASFPPPATNCAFGPVQPPPSDENAANAIAASAEAASFCCEDYPDDVRDGVEQCECTLVFHVSGVDDQCGISLDADFDAFAPAWTLLEQTTDGCFSAGPVTVDTCSALTSTTITSPGSCSYVRKKLPPAPDSVGGQITWSCAP